MKTENLRRSAFLNSLTSVIDFAAKMGVGFVLNPIMISLLGPIYFGAWQVIGQLNSYMATADIRAATSLKFILSRDRSVKNDLELKETVSAALYSNFIFIPFYLLAGAFIVWYAPILAGVTEQYFYPIRVASSLLVISFIVTQFFFLFESTLHGMNLSYKRIGIRAIITLLGGGATALALYMGYGIIGMAAVQIIITVATGLSFWWIVKKHIPWFEFVMVQKSQIFIFIKLSGWYMLLKVADLLSNSVDMILLGFFAGPVYVSSYAITKYSMTATSGLVRTVSNATAIGIAKFIGEKNYSKLVAARAQVVMIQWILIMVGGSMVCLLNASFVELWTKENLFSGQLETLLIVLIATITLLSQVDSSIIASTLNIKRKIIITFVSSLIIIVLSALLVPSYGTLGLLNAILLGTVFLSVSNSYIVMQLTSKKEIISDLYFSRFAISAMLIFIGSSFLADFIDIRSWSWFFMYSALYLFILLAIIGIVILNKNHRILIYNSVQKLKK